MTRQRQKSSIDVREVSDKNVAKLSQFEWDELRGNVAIYLAQGYTIQETAEEFNISSRTINRWKREVEFSAEIDRLSLMVDIANRAERLRIAMRMARQIGYRTERDLLEWLKFAQSETDGAKIGLADDIDTAILAAMVSVAGSRPNRDSRAESSESGSEASRTIIDTASDMRLDSR